MNRGSGGRRFSMFAALMAIAVAGCDRRPPVVELCCKTSRGAGAAWNASTVAAPLAHHLFVVPNGAHVSTICTGDEADLYLTGAPGCDGGQLLRDAAAAVAAATADLPVGWRLEHTARLPRGATGPVASMAQVARFAMTIDPARAAAAGVTIAQIDDVLSLTVGDATRPAAVDQIAAIEATQVPTRGGQHVRLGDIATVTVHPEPVAVRSDFY